MKAIPCFANSTRKIMRKFFILLLSSFPPILCFSQSINNYEMRKENDEEFHRKRNEWIQSLHRCEEGLPYWILDNKAKEVYREMVKETQSNSILQNSYANGRIIGQWIEKGSDNLSGRVHTLDFDTVDKTIILASAGGNIWKGTIKGNDWVCLNNSQRFPNPRMVKIFDLSGKKRIVVVANSPSSVYFTDDFGKNWVKSLGLDNAEKWGWMIRGQVTIDQSIYVLLTEWDFKNWKSVVSLYKSSDFAQSFSKIYSAYLDFNNSQLCDIWAPRYDINILYFAIKDTLYTIDSQNNFSIVRINNFVDKYTEGVMVRGCAIGKDLHLYLAIQDNNVKTTFYYSTDGGKSFTRNGSLDFYPFEKNSFEVSQAFPTFLYFGQVEFYYSTNNGSRWSRLNAWYEYYSKPETKLHADIPGIVSFRIWNSQSKRFIDYVFISTDGGLYLLEFSYYYYSFNVTNLSMKNLNISQYYSVYTYKKDPKVIFAGSQDQGFQRCLTDSGKALSFSQIISGDYGHLGSSDGGDHLWCVYPGFAMLAFQPYEIISYLKSWDFVGGRFLWLPPIITDPKNPLVAYVLSGDNQLPTSTSASFIYKLTYLESEDSIVYEVIPFNFALDDPNRKVSYFAISPLKYKYWYAISNDGVFFRSTDSGNNWEVISDFAGPKGHYFYGNKILPSRLQVGKIVVAGSGYSTPGVFISYDTGKTFTPLSNSLPSTLFFDVEFNEDESLLFAATEIGPFVYHFAEGKWYSLSGIDCPDQVFWDIEYLPSLNTVRFATYGRGIWDFKIEKVLDVKDVLYEIPSKIDIKVYPNPSSSSFRIDINTDQNSFLFVEIFDTEGKLLKRLWKGYLNSEYLNLEWDCTTDEGYKVASGNYIVVATSGFVSKYYFIQVGK